LLLFKKIFSKIELLKKKQLIITLVKSIASRRTVISDKNEI